MGGVCRLRTRRNGLNEVQPLVAKYPPQLCLFVLRAAIAPGVEKVDRVPGFHERQGQTEKRCSGGTLWIFIERRVRNNTNPEMLHVSILSRQLPVSIAVWPPAYQYPGAAINS